MPEAQQAARPGVDPRAFPRPCARAARRASYLKKTLQDSCKEYIAKNDKIKDAWAGASQKDRLRRNHTQLQRRLTSSRQ